LSIKATDTIRVGLCFDLFLHTYALFLYLPENENDEHLSTKICSFEPNLRSVLNLMRSFIMNIKIVGIDLARDFFKYALY
jgi:hypothetical protein